MTEPNENASDGRAAEPEASESAATMDLADAYVCFMLLRKSTSGIREYGLSCRACGKRGQLKGNRMDAKQIELEDRLVEILRQAAAVACQIQQREQGGGTPHYDQIETAAHNVGQQLSRMVQHERTGALAAEQSVEAKCPECCSVCPVTAAPRQVRSVDGPVEVIESVAFCVSCRRSFFPSAGSSGT